MQFNHRPLHLAVLFVVHAWPVTAQESALPDDVHAVLEAGGNLETVPFPAEFFAPYNPVNARDMVEQVPGFQIDAGGGSRGFGGAAGNLLINGERPSTKNDDAGAMLGRIPAGQVQRIELIRGETAGLDLRGQTVVVNVILRDDAEAAVRWEALSRTTAETGTLNPYGSISKTGRRGDTRYTIGFEGGEDRFHQPNGPELLWVGGAVAERRAESAWQEGRGYSANLNMTSQWGDALLHVNGRVGERRTEETETSRRLALLPGFTTRLVLEGDKDETATLELGGDAEFPLAAELTAKTIVLLNRADSKGSSSLRVLDAGGAFLSASRAPRETEEGEYIGRLELDWTGLPAQHLEANFEGTLNTLENDLALFQDDGSGARPVPLPGANTRVEEVRWDLEFTHSWTTGPWTLDSALAAEASTISQRGDAERERSFFFLKPRLMLTHAPAGDRQARLRLQREVAQLDFNDFVSATNFGDRQFDLGNPELKPERTTVAALTYERRFGEVGAVNLTAFHHWIEDVQDLLPLQGIFEIPGNIGDGRRWGLETEMTFPLDGLGLPGGRVDLSGRWQDSTVTDPVTGLSRVLSEEGRYALRLDFRQNLPAWQLAWGGMVALESEVPAFGLDEFVKTDSIDDVPDMDLYLETTRWFGLRTRLKFGNVFDRSFHRDRRVFDGPRGLSPLAYREVRDRVRSPSVELSVTGSF